MSAIITCAVHLDLTNASDEPRADTSRRIRLALDDLPGGYVVQLQVSATTPLDLADVVACCYSKIQVTAPDAHTARRWHRALAIGADA